LTTLSSVPLACSTRAFTKPNILAEVPREVDIGL
jgi:hypothetical protein